MAEAVHVQTVLDQQLDKVIQVVRVEDVLLWVLHLVQAVVHCNQVKQAIVVLTDLDMPEEIMTMVIVAQEAEAQVQPVLLIVVIELVALVKHTQFQVQV